jgi:hypothetical protein
MLKISYLGLCTDLLAFDSEERKPSARIPSLKAVRPVIASDRIPYLQMTSVGPYSISGKEVINLK